MFKAFFYRFPVMILLGLGITVTTSVADVTTAPPEVLNSYPYALLSTNSIDLGRLQAGGQGQGSVTITNGGRHELIISRVRSSCGLLITTWPTQPLKTGEKGTITFRYDTARPGPFERNIVIHTNAWLKNLVIPVKGEVLPANIKPSD